MLECCTLLGALAEATSTIELGTMVANVWNRQPGALVTAAATVAIVSGGRRLHLGIGAGSSPSSPFAREQVVTGAPPVADLAERHRRLVDVVELARRTWAEDRDAELATFPLPRPRPSILVGTNGPTLSRIAGEIADGINVPWRHERRDELLAVATDAAGSRPFERTVYALYDRALLDPEHPDRMAMAEMDVDRLILVQLGELAW